MTTYKHSGTLGDLVYSLSVVKKMGGGEFQVALHNIETCVAQYGYNPNEVAPVHRGRFSMDDFKWLKPFLESQDYITQATTWQQGDAEPDVDLDRFRGVLFRGFEGNYVEAYHRTFNLPFLVTDYDTPWLSIDNPVTIRPMVVSRTFRYRDPAADATWRDMAESGNLKELGVFLGTEAEYRDFIQVTGVQLPWQPVADFLELARIVAGAELVMANQNFVYSLAMGLGKQSILETIKIKPLINNECFFPRQNCQYF